MAILRLYLLLGLVAHKLLWEWMKRRRPRRSTATNARRRVIRAVKILILVGLVLQTLVPESWVAPSSLPRDLVATRLAGVVVYTVGLALAMLGRLQLGDNWSDIEAARVAPDHQIVDQGVYRFIRHPIYVGDLLLLIGFELALNSWLVLAALALVPIVLRQAIREERLLVGSLAGYAEYCRRTKRFVPFVV